MVIFEIIAILILCFWGVTLPDFGRIGLSENPVSDAE
jgi:hypothetical protein